MKFNEYFKLRDITLNISNKCNLACPYCFENNKSNKLMTKETVEVILDKCYKNYIDSNNTEYAFGVNFFGGEPFLNFDVMEHAMKYAREKNYKMVFGVTSNLTILTDHMLDVIEEYDLGILVSIDGIKQIHDRNRCNSYDKVKENVKKLMDRHLGYLLEARMTILPEDVDELLNSIKSIVDMGIVNIAPVPVTDVNWTNAQLLKLENNLKKVWDWVIDIYNDDENKKNISIKFIEDYLEKVLMIPLVDSQKKVCVAGTFSSCSIGVDGDILPCHQRHSVRDGYEDLLMGNILDDNDIKEIEFNKCTIEGAFDCNTCIANSICKGGCPSENYTKNGNGNKMNEVQCMITSILAGVAYEYQMKIMSCSNIRSHRLNVLSQNLNLMKILFEEVLTCNPLSKEYVIKIMYFYEKLIDMEDILLPSFSEVFRTVINELVNNNMELISVFEGDNNEL